MYKVCKSLTCAHIYVSLKLQPLHPVDIVEEMKRKERKKRIHNRNIRWKFINNISDACPIYNTIPARPIIQSVSLALVGIVCRIYEDKAHIFFITHATLEKFSWCISLVCKESSIVPKRKPEMIARKVTDHEWSSIMHRKKNIVINMLFKIINFISVENIETLIIISR